MKKLLILKRLFSILIFLLLSIVFSTSFGGAESCYWTGVERAKINSHQPNAWCPNGAFLVGFDQDGDKQYSGHDAPVVGQAMCCNPRNVNEKWASTIWVGVHRANISSHQLKRWCPDSMFLVGLDLDGEKQYSAYDSPVVGQAMCGQLQGVGFGGTCLNVSVGQANINSHQPNRWCPEGTYLVGLDLDGGKGHSEHDGPVVGQAMCCSLGN